MHDQDAATLDHARRAYLGEANDDWEGRWDLVQRLAEYMRERVAELLCTGLNQTS